MTKRTATEPVEIYVACLAAYNNGVLHGTWLDATLEPLQIMETVSKMLEASPEPGSEEWAIHDYSGFGSLRLSEYESLERVQAIACLIAEHGPLAVALLDDQHGDLEYARRVLDSGSCVGPYGSVADYAREYMQDHLGVTCWLVPYIDYERLARDLLLSGQISSIEADGQVYVLLDP